MKISLLLLLLVSQFALGQNDENIRTSFGIGGGLGLRMINIIPNVQNFNSTILTYAGKPQPDWFGKYYAIDDRGEVKEVQFGEFNADLYARFDVYGRNGNGWLFNAGYTFSRYSFSYDNTPFQFKGYTLSRRNGDFETRGIQAGIARFWNGVWFARMSGLYFHRYTLGGFNRPIDATYQQNYIENGTGFQVELRALEPNRFAVIPEIGLTSAQHPAEISVAVTVPLGKYAFAEQYTYYKNRQFVGGATSTYSNFVATINVRFGFSLFRSLHKPRRVRLAKTTPSVPPPTPSVVVTPPVSGNSRFDQIPLRESTRLAVFFDLEKAELSRSSFSELNEMARWLTANPTIRIRLDGHTDLLGNAPENMHLSLRRVEAVKDYLINKGVPSHQIDLKGFGETRPLNRNCPSPNYCPENRRVEMVIVQR